MISDKTVELTDKAKNYFEENKIYTSKQVCYGYSEKLIELVVEECIEVVSGAKRSDRDRPMLKRALDICKAQKKRLV
jgi:flagellin-specific chaperone FliS